LKGIKVNFVDDEKYPKSAEKRTIRDCCFFLCQFNFELCLNINIYIN